MCPLKGKFVFPSISDIFVGFHIFQFMSLYPILVLFLVYPTNVLSTIMLLWQQTTLNVRESDETFYIMVGRQWILLSHPCCALASFTLTPQALVVVGLCSFIIDTRDSRK